MIDFRRLGYNAEETRLWNEFLQAWPIARLRTMILIDYSNVGSVDTFTAWLEHRLETMGSMWGGSAFKFGIFNRSDKDKKEGVDAARYTDNYAWYATYGDTPRAAFARIRDLVVAVAEAATRGDLAAIEGVDLAPVFKWKIAFHYQPPDAPKVLAIFKPEPLRRYLKTVALIVPLGQLYRDALAKKPADVPFAEFCRAIYATWEDSLQLWKITQSKANFSDAIHARLLRGRLIAISAVADEPVAELFRAKAKIGDLFYLTREASVLLLGRITAPAQPFEENGIGSYSRAYEVLRYAAPGESVRPDDSLWTPKGGAAFCAIEPATLEVFQRSLLRPVFNLDLQTLEELRDAAKATSLEITLTEETIDSGYAAFPLSQSIFPETSYCDDADGVKGEPVRIVTEYGDRHETDILVETETARPRTRFYKYYKSVGARPGDVIRVSGTPGHLYLMRLIPAWIAPVALPTRGENTTRATYTEAAPSLNVILYGPPGTGKTYSTADRAVQICDGVVSADRAELMRRYAHLCEQGRITFVTFHPSFSYEDFVEGIRPEVDAEGQISNDVRDGIFKRICNVARERFAFDNPGPSINFAGRKLFKVSLGSAQESADSRTFERCIEENVVVLGYGSDIDFTGCDSLSAVHDRFRGSRPDATLHSEYNVTAIHYLKNEMRNGDLVLISDGNFKFRAIGEITGDYHYVRSNAGRYQTRPVRWLKVPNDSLPIEIVFTKRLSQLAIYLMDQKAVKWEALKTLVAPSAEVEDDENYVLIIDEINRGDISKTLGELVTLLEPDKRLDAANSLRVKLPHSGKDFGVPSNLYIVATMNTADRAVSLLDTALRRRFEFVEMRPRPELLSEDAEGVNLRQLLEAVNRRIEFLLDREHAIGHAYFFAVETLDQLNTVFRLKIIPLLQEYFYEDWEKVCVVLNDDGATGGGFLVAEELAIPARLHAEDFRSQRRHRVSRDVFTTAAFHRIYEVPG